MSFSAASVITAPPLILRSSKVACGALYGSIAQDDDTNTQYALLVSSASASDKDNEFTLLRSKPISVVGSSNSHVTAVTINFSSEKFCHQEYDTSKRDYLTYVDCLGKYLYLARINHNSIYFFKTINLLQDFATTMSKEADPMEAYCGGEYTNYDHFMHTVNLIDWSNEGDNVEHIRDVTAHRGRPAILNSEPYKSQIKGTYKEGARILYNSYESESIVSIYVDDSFDGLFNERNLNPGVSGQFVDYDLKVQPNFQKTHHFNKKKALSPELVEFIKHHPYKIERTEYFLVGGRFLLFELNCSDLTNTTNENVLEYWRYDLVKNEWYKLRNFKSNKAPCKGSSSWYGNVGAFLYDLRDAYEYVYTGPANDEDAEYEAYQQYKDERSKLGKAIICHDVDQDYEVSRMELPRAACDRSSANCKQMVILNDHLYLTMDEQGIARIPLGKPIFPRHKKLLDTTIVTSKKN